MGVIYANRQFTRDDGGQDEQVECEEEVEEHSEKRQTLCLGKYRATSFGEFQANIWQD